MKLINITPNPIKFLIGNQIITLPVDKTADVVTLIQSSETSEVCTESGVVTINETKIEAVVNLPPEQPDTIYIANENIARCAAKRGRRDVVAPDDPIYDGENIVAYRALRRF